MDVHNNMERLHFSCVRQDAVFKLEASKMSITSLHGEMTKLQRQKSLDAFKRGRYRALLVSDVAARGAGRARLRRGGEPGAAERSLALCAQGGPDGPHGQVWDRVPDGIKEPVLRIAIL